MIAADGARGGAVGGDPGGAPSGDPGRAPGADRSAPPVSETPYRGLAPFTASDYDYFFGRKRDAAHIAASTITEALVVLFGPSGVGKSSVLGAALPRAIDAIIEDTLIVPFFRWEAGFYPTLLNRAKARAGVPEDADVASLESLAEHWIETRATPVIFVFDQFEQYFLIPPAEDGGGEGVRSAFEIDIARTVNRRDLDAHVLISIREDALYELDRLRGRLPCILADPMRLDYIDEKSAEQAIREPLRVYRDHCGEAAGPVAIEDALVAELLARARRAVDPTQYETPYLQLVLERLWNEEQRLDSALLRLETYARLNGWEGIATSHVRHTLETALGEDDREMCAALFDRMVTPSGMKITLAAEDLAVMVNAAPDRVEAVMTTLGHPDSRIIRSVAPAQDSGQRRYEIFHDVLARPILAWKHAFNAEREQRHLREEAEREQQRLRVEAEAERVRQQREIDAQTRRAAAQRRIAKRFQRISIAATALAVMALLLAGWAGHSYRQAAKQRAQVLAMRADLATNSGDSREGLLLALEALPEDPGLSEWFRRPIIDDAANALERVLFRPIGRTLTGHADDLMTVAYSPDGASILTASEDHTVRIWRVADGLAPVPRLVLQHQAPISSARFSRDGRLIVTAAQDGWAYLWAASDGAKLTEWQVGPARPTIVDLSPDNTLVAAVGYGSNASLWSWDPSQEVEAGTMAAPPEMITELWDADGVTHGGGTNNLVFDTTGDRVATTSWSGDARIWDVRTARLIRTLPRAIGDAQGRCLASAPGHCAPIISATFTASGPGRVVTASFDRTAKIWDLSTGKVMVSLIGHDRSVISATFSTDGQRVITAALDGTVRIWNAESGEMLQILQGPAAVSGPTASAALSPDEAHLVASFSSPAAYLWDLHADLAPVVLPNLSDAVPAAALSADDRVLVAATGLAVGLHDPASGEALAEASYLDGAVMSVAASPDGRDVLASAGRRVEIFDMERWIRDGLPPSPRRLGQHDNLVLSALYSPDGRRIVTASQDGTAKIWMAADGTLVGDPLRHDGAVFCATFDRDGDRVLTGSMDGTVRIWNAGNGKPLTVVRVGEPVLDATFSADGVHVVVTTLDMAQARTSQPPYFQTSTAIWDSETGNRLEANNREALQDVKFLQLANLVVVGTRDGVVRLSDALDEDPVAILPSHRSSIKRITASPGGERLATVSADGTIRVWKLPPAEPHALVRYANAVADRYLKAEQRTLSAQERRAFGLDDRGETLSQAVQEWLKATWRSMVPW